MPIHFSIGFVVENRPRRQFESFCAKAYIEQEIDAVACMSDIVQASMNSQQKVSVIWKREYRRCK